jgi:nucleotide-binding universal stress UspA family protein
MPIRIGAAVEDTMIKDILTLLDLNSETPARSLAVDLAGKANAHLTGLAPIIEPVMPGYMAGSIPTEVLENASVQSRQMAQQSADNFTDFARSQGINAETRLVAPAGGGGTNAFSIHCRMTDLVVIAQDDPDAPQTMRMALIEAALFDGCAPLILVPYIGADAFVASHIMLAWDGSKTAARAVHSALPILKMANKIDLVIVGKPPALAGEPGADIALYLARRGMKVEIHQLPRGTSSVSDVLLNYICDKDIDLAVMGGYGHSRMREFILGGATKGMLGAMTVPVLMAH